VSKLNVPLVLVSHALCPYVQRVAIVLAEKGLPFERRDIDLANKPEWFLKISPLGKTPVLLVGDQAIFESAVICEYLEETALPSLHPSDPLKRAKHRAWMEFSSTLLNSIAALYIAPNEPGLALRIAEIRSRLTQIEDALVGDGIEAEVHEERVHRDEVSGEVSEGEKADHEARYFADETFSMVDVAFGPAFRYFDVMNNIGGINDLGFREGLPKLQRWRRALAMRPSIIAAVRPDYPARLHAFFLARESALSRRIKK
jgi:glutathione S-transferase